MILYFPRKLKVLRRLSLATSQFHKTDRKSMGRSRTLPIPRTPGPGDKAGGAGAVAVSQGGGPNTKNHIILE